MFQKFLFGTVVFVAAVLAVRARNVSQVLDRCPSGKFGDGCRFDCHCQLSETCDLDSGACFYGCAENYSGPACQSKILSGSATQSFTRPSESVIQCYWWYSHQSGTNTRGEGYCRSTREVYKTYDAENALTTDKCAMIHKGENRWWKQDLQGDYVVTEIEMNVTGPANVRVGPFFHRTDVMPLCSTAPAGLHNTTCRPARRGRFVVLDFPVRNDTDPPLIICNVRVSGYKYNSYCPSGRFGPACVSQCLCMMTNERCDHTDGSCSSGCRPDKIGYGCDWDFKMTSDVEVTSSAEGVMVTFPAFKHAIDSRRGSVGITYIVEIFNGVWREVTNSPQLVSGVIRMPLGDLEPYTNYLVRVTLARKAIGNVLVRGPPGPETNFTSPCGAPTRGPEITIIEPLISNFNYYPSRIEATVYWKPVPNEYANCDTVKTYNLKYRHAFGQWTSVYIPWLNPSRNGTSRYELPDVLSIQQTRIANLDPSTIYEFQLVASNIDRVFRNVQTAGDVVAVKTPVGVFRPVTNLTFNVSTTTAVLEWNAPNDTNIQEDLLGYRITYAETEIINCSNTRGVARVMVTKDAEVVLEDLEPYRRYNVSVCALSEAGCGPALVKDVLTKGQVSTATPSAAAVTGILARSVRVTFQHLPCHLRLGQFKNFQAVLMMNGSVQSTLISRRTVNDVRDLKPNTEYALKYRWVSEFGGSPFTQNATFRTAIAVSGPPQITNHVATPGFISLLWQPPAVTNGDVIDYESWCSLPGVQRLVARQPIKKSELSTSPQIHVFDNGVMSRRLYRCKIRAYNSAGAGQWSVVENVMTDFKNDLGPRNFIATIVENSNPTLTCQWKEPLITRGILGYRLQCHSGNFTETLFQTNLFVGTTKYTHVAEEDITSDLTCKLSTRLPKGKGQTVTANLPIPSID